MKQLKLSPTVYRNAYDNIGFKIVLETREDGLTHIKKDKNNNYIIIAKNETIHQTTNPKRECLG